MRALLFATLARAETAAKLSAALGADLTIADTEDQVIAAIPEANAYPNLAPSRAARFRSSARRVGF